MVAVRVGGVLGEPGGLSDALGQVFREVADVATGFLGATQDALDMYLRPEPDDVCRFGQLLTRLIPGRQRCPGVGVSERSRAGIPHRQPVLAIKELVMGRPPHLVVGRGGNCP